MLWFNFILGSNFFLLFLGMVMYDNNMIMSLKQKKRKFEPRMKLNHNIYLDASRLGVFTTIHPSCIFLIKNILPFLIGSNAPATFS